MASSSLTDLNLDKVRKVINVVLPDRDLSEIRDRGLWVRQTYELVFDGGDQAFMKLHVHPEWLDSTSTEAELCELLCQHDLPAPETLFLDTAGEYLGFPFIIHSALPGKPLSHWLNVLQPATWPKLFSAVGVTYAKMHKIKGPASGVWDGSLEKTLPISPNDFYFQNEIISGSGKALLNSGRISQRVYDKIIKVWEDALPVLKSHEPSLIHGSPFPWTICLSQKSGQWIVSRLNALGDFLWWDSAYDQSCLQYPPGYSWPKACLAAFWDSYGKKPDVWRINTYALLQHLCALNGVFMPPQLPISAVGLTEQEMNARLRNILAFF